MMAIEELKKLAESGKDADWEQIDAEIPKICNNPLYLERCGKLINNENEGVRDLAVSILEKTKHLTGRNKKMLSILMKTDPNNYVKYRSAFALAAHGDMSNKIKNVLEQAKGDEATAEIAEGYLSQAS